MHFALLLAIPLALAQSEPGAWKGFLQDSAGQAVAAAQVEMRAPNLSVRSQTGVDGGFEFRDLAPGRYSLTVQWKGGSATLGAGVEISPGVRLSHALRLTGDGKVLLETSAGGASESTGGEQLSSRQVSALPLNKRDFSQLLLLAAGTQTDANGAANFTQQFTVNGQRGTATVFAMDGIYATDPELGGATFSNFNVDAIEEIESSSGVMSAEIGQGAAGFTNIISKSGSPQIHGSLFAFVRNAVFDARNFFDRRSVAQPGRIPPFVRNEFGGTSGGPVVLPRIYDGRNRTFYFAQYQGFRQVLGTTQVIPVPTPQERTGRNSTAFPGDTLIVPVSPKVAPILERYPLPNDLQGPYGERTYATSSKVDTVSDQFSARIDHRISEKGQLFARFNFNNVTGPLTNPSQTAVDPSFATRFFDHQRNFGLTYTRTASARFTWETSFGFLRATPNFPTLNRTEPALRFADGLYEAFNSAAGGVSGSYGNLFQLRQNFTWVRGAHTWKAGADVRVNRDTTIFGMSPNGAYTFGGGAAYSPVEIRSLSGLHDIHVGDPLPDALSGFLTATPFSYTTSAAPPIFAQGERMGDSAPRRQAYNFYIQDTWKVSARLVLSYGLRYEFNSRIKEAKLRTSHAVFEDSSGAVTDPAAPGARARLLINPQPPYERDWTGWSPRLAIDWRWNDKTLFRAAASTAPLLPNLWQDNFITGGLPYVVTPYQTAAPGAPIPFQNSVRPIELPPIYTPTGQLVYPTGRSTDVAPNTEMDLLRFERDLAALSPDKQVNPMSSFGMSPGFRNGYVASYTAGLERSVGDVMLAASYVATMGVKLVRLDYPNGYGGADPAFAPYTIFDSSGRAQGGYGPILLATNHSHSTYHALQATAKKTSLRAGLGFQGSYTYSKSLDDTSAVLGGFVAGASGTVLQSSPQNPANLRQEKGPSTFDVTHVFAFSLIQELPAGRVPLLRKLGKRFTSGWQAIGMATLTSGSPFTVYSGIQQTGVGSNGSDRPDQVGQPELSTGRKVREDYFGRGAGNASFFSIPIGEAGGTGPNRGRFGTLGRNTLRGPAYNNFDISLTKNTPIGPGRNAERAVLQFRAEVFNFMNLVNFGLPANIVLGPGFGLINRTAGTSRQIQFSLKLLY